MQSCAFLPALLLAASFISQAANAQSNALPINNNAGLLLLQQNARAGDAKAEYRLGMIYLNGEGVSQDYKQAADWFSAAAKQGSADGEFALGYLFERGKGVPRNFASAAAYYATAARQGHSTAENNLGSMYEQGQGIPQDLGEALRWYRASAEHGDTVGHDRADEDDREPGGGRPGV